jgi:hypothetical protein
MMPVPHFGPATGKVYHSNAPQCRFIAANPLLALDAAHLLARSA